MTVAAGTRVIALRPATAGDCERVYDWASEPGTRSSSFHPEPIPRAAHERWYADCLASRTRQLLIAEDGTRRPLGFVRFDRDAPAARHAEISINIDAAQRGRGWSSPLLEAAKREAVAAGIESLTARIRVGNDVSRRVFVRAGFQLHGNETVAGAAAVRYLWTANADAGR